MRRKTGGIFLMPGGIFFRRKTGGIFFMPGGIFSKEKDRWDFWDFRSQFSGKLLFEGVL